MKDQWYCGVNGQQYGPYTWDQLRAMAAEGRIVPQTYVRREIDQQWRSASQIPGLLIAKDAAARPAAVTATTSARTGTATKKLVAAKPLAAAVVAPAASPAASPAAASPAASVPVGLAIAPGAPPKVGALSDEAVQPRRKGSPLVLVGILGGAALAVAVVGIAVVAWSWLGPGAGEGDALTDSEQALAAEGDPVVATPAEANPGDRKAAPAGIAGSAAGDSSAASAAAARKVLEAQARWGNVERYSIKINDVHVKVTGVWLATDAAGTWVEPTLPEKAGSSAAPAGKYVFVEVRLFNGGSVPRKFRSWNEGPSVAAAMADDEGDVLAPVPAEATSGVPRLSSLRLLPGQAVSDTLVFQAPDDPFETLRLALAYSALAESSSRHIAFEVPVDVLFRKRGDGGNDPAAAVADAATDAAAAPGQSGRLAPRDDIPLAERADHGKMPAKKGGPPSVADLNKQFEEFDKTAKVAPPVKPAAEPAKPAAEASPFQPVQPMPAAAENPFQPVAPAKPAAPAKTDDAAKPGAAQP